MVDVYIGELDDPKFKWDGGNWNGNVPQRKSPFFPLGHTAFSLLIRKIKEETYEGKQTDWGGFVAKTTPEEMIAFLDELYATHTISSTADFFEKEIQKVKDYVNTLESDKQYALVGCEI